MNMKKSLLIFFVTIASVAFAQTWTNPFTLDLGDPYILKDRGTFYLYASNGDEQILKCWSSKDLINWSDPYTCSTDIRIVGAYAPEVVYWNGTYYMYTSPHGNGHYVLTSPSPTGPFVAVTGNLGKVIDGSVFIDDDAKWYFYHADGAGIFGCSMPTPTSIGADVNLNAQMNGQWTEGPGVIKRNGIYYLLYTGNHVLSPGYRIDYGKNIIGPIRPYTPQVAQNPILISSEGSFRGLGHGAAFIGPDLDTYFFTYHNLKSNIGGSPTRHFNIDRMAWNGDKLLMLGGTNWAQQAPQLATTDYFNRTDIGTNWTMPNGGNWGLSNHDMMFQDVMNESPEMGYKAIFTSSTASDYTAEFTVKEVARNSNSAKFGAVFSYRNEQNYGIALLHSATNQLEINFLIENIWGTAQYIDLPAGFNCAVWHSIRIEKQKTSYKFYVDKLQKASLTSNLKGGQVGYMTSLSQGNFGYIAFSNKVDGSGIFDVYKPIPGNIAAVHYNTGGESVGYHDLTAGNAGGKYNRNDSVDISTNVEGGYHISGNQTGEWYKYNVNIQSTGIYNVGIRYAATGSASQIKIWQGDTDVTGVINLPATGGMGIWRTFTIHDLNLTSGYQTLKIETINGDFDFCELQFKPANNEIVTKTDHFDTAYSSDWNYSDGNWAIVSGQADINGFGKKCMGSTGWTDYTIEADVTYINSMNAGIIFRVINPAQGGADDNSNLGTDFLQGYYVGIYNNNVSLGKHNYCWANLTSTPGTYSLNMAYHIKIVTSGANIKVYVTDMVTPKIDYTDSNPFITGKVGLRSCNVHVRFDNFTVTTSSNLGTGIKDISSNLNINELEMFPNPVGNILTINAAKKAVAKIYNTAGQLMIFQLIEGNNNRISTSQLTKGIYVVKLCVDGIDKSLKLIKG
jgi:xylan 1,4-beta-xylosidase